MHGLTAAWIHRNTLAEAMEQALDWVAAELRHASADDLIDFLGSFSPARAAGPEWTASFERLVEQMWEHLPPETLAEMEAHFRARGPMWAPVANSFTPDHGERLRDRRWRPGGARRPAVVLR
jgi:hypothetical protein